MTDREKFKQFMASMGEVHDKTISPVLMEIYWEVLVPFSDDQCINAFKTAMLSLKFFPKPADLVEILRGKTENRSTEAWLKTLNAVKRVGNYQSVKFDDEVIHSVIEAMGGWERLCMMECDEEKWKQKEFERLYSVLSSHPGSHPDYLPGTTELTNFRTGFQKKTPIMQIGNTEQKRLEEPPC